MPFKKLSREDHNTLRAIHKMATYLTGFSCKVMAVRHATSPGLLRYTVKVPRCKKPLAVAPGSKTDTLGLNKLADVLATKTLRKLYEGIKIVGDARGVARSSSVHGAGSSYLRDVVAVAAAENLPSVG